MAVTIAPLRFVNSYTATIRCQVNISRLSHLRHVHLSRPRQALLTAQPGTVDPTRIHTSTRQQRPPLSLLSTSAVLRTLLITSVTSSSLLFKASLVILKRMLQPRALFFSPDHNPVLKAVFKHTFYKQFCAGEDPTEVQQTIQAVRNAGYRGVILEYALEMFGEQEVKATTADQIEVWRDGMLATVSMCSPGDYIALKWSGLGAEALRRLDMGDGPSTEMQAAMTEVCDLALSKNVAILPSAELEKTNVGVHAWTIDLQRKYNGGKAGKAIIYSTYQAYLRSAADHIARDLEVAQREGFTLGVKLVRGAYLESEPAHAVMESKQATDDNYDGIMAAILSQQWNDTLRPAHAQSAGFPSACMVIATHNARSIRRARQIRDKQAASGQSSIPCIYAQLQGMADEISCDLLASSSEGVIGSHEASSRQLLDKPRVYKFITWGTVGQCLNYLTRRALENQDAVSRTRDTRDAMATELFRRIRASLGLRS